MTSTMDPRSTSEDVTLTPEDIVQVQAALRAKAWSFAERIAPVYAQLQWQWVTRWPGVPDSDQRRYVPSAIEIANTLFQLIRGLTPESCSPTTGGLVVYGEKNDDGSLTAGIRFELSTDCPVPE